MDMEDAKLIISILAVVFTILNFVYARVAVQHQLTERLAHLESFRKDVDERRRDRDKDIEQIWKVLDELREVIPKVDLFWDIIREHVPKMLLHPDEEARDILLIKLSNNTIKHDEAIDLKALLENELEHLKQNKEVMDADPHAALLPFALWALEEKLRRTGKDLPPTVKVKLEDEH